MERIRQRLLIAWADYRLHHATRVVVKGVVGLLIFSGTAAPLIVATASHKKPAVAKPATSKTVTRKVAVAPAKTAAQPAPKPAAAAPAATPAPAAAPASTQPVSRSQPSPGSGAKSLAPATSGSTSTSSGSSGGTGTTSPPSSGSAPPAATGGYTSTNWSGYVATAGGYTSVTGAWTVPSATGNGSTPTADSTWIGIGGVFASDLIQTGTENTVSASGQVNTSAFYELLPGAALLISSLTVSAGDQMTATISETAPSQWSVSITDTTSGQNYSTSVAYSSGNSSAEWVEEDPSYFNGSLVPFDHFGSTAFTSGASNVGNLSASNSQPITMVNSSGQPLVTPSVLTGGGSGFTLTED